METGRGGLLSLGGVLEDVVGVVHVVAVDLVLVIVVAGSDGPSDSGGSEKNSAKERGSCEMHFEFWIESWLDFGKDCCLFAGIEETDKRKINEIGKK
jgi:hypothetical protein